LPVVELPEDADELPEDAAELPVLEAAAPESAGAEEIAPETDTAEPEWQEGPGEASFEASTESASAHAGTGATAETAASAATTDTSAAPEPRVDWPPGAERRVVALRLVAPQPERFAGRSLRQALAAEGFVLGRFDIFHKGDEEQRAILSAASLSQPGTFDAATMDSQHFGGLSLFAVLPGPKSPPEAFEELVSTARSLNDRLCGVLQDEGGTPLTPARIASLKARLNSGAPA
jgi:FtsZ-interacting cell division protein ZipA